MKRFIIYAVVTALAFMLSASAHATAILSEQKGTDNGVNSAEHTFKWSHALKFSGDHEAEPFKFYHYFGSSQDNKEGQKSQNVQEDALRCSHSFTLSGDQQEAPFRFNYHYGSLIDVEGNYMSMNGPEYAKWQGDVPDTAQHFYYYESCGLGGEPDTGYIRPECPHAAPEPVSILLMGLGSLWIAAQR